MTDNLNKTFIPPDLVFKDAVNPPLLKNLLKYRPLNTPQVQDEILSLFPHLAQDVGLSQVEASHSSFLQLSHHSLKVQHRAIWPNL